MEACIDAYELKLFYMNKHLVLSPSTTITDAHETYYSDTKDKILFYFTNTSFSQSRIILLMYFVASSRWRNRNE